MIRGHELGSSGVSPQWVMLGVELNPERWPAEWAAGWRYLVVGSSELGRADLVNETVMDRSRLPGSAYRRNEIQTRSVLTAELRSYTLAFGATYTEALARLMGEWDPDAGRDPHPELEAGPRRRQTLAEHLIVDHQLARERVGWDRDTMLAWHATDHTAGVEHTHDHVDSLEGS